MLGLGVPTLSPPNKSTISGAGRRLGREVRTEGAYLSQIGDEEESALKGRRHLLQEVESLRKVPKFKFVNKRDSLG